MVPSAEALIPVTADCLYQSLEATFCTKPFSPIVKTPTQRQLNNNSTKVGFDSKMTLHTTPPPHPTPPPTETFQPLLDMLGS